jgi:hypothetical protein
MVIIKLEDYRKKGSGGGDDTPLEEGAFVSVKTVEQAFEYFAEDLRKRIIKVRQVPGEQNQVAAGYLEKSIALLGDHMKKEGVVEFDKDKPVHEIKNLSDIKSIRDGIIYFCQAIESELELFIDESLTTKAKFSLAFSASRELLEKIRAEVLNRNNKNTPGNDNR